MAATSQTTKEAHNIVTEAIPAARSFGKQAGDAAEKALDGFKDYYSTSRKYAVSHPERAIATAAAVGVVFGGLMALVLRRH